MKRQVELSRCRSIEFLKEPPETLIVDFNYPKEDSDIEAEIAADLEKAEIKERYLTAKQIINFCLDEADNIKLVHFDVVCRCTGNVILTLREIAERRNVCFQYVQKIEKEFLAYMAAVSNGDKNN